MTPKRSSGWVPPIDIDKEVVSLCKAINDNFKGIKTTESCCGHGKKQLKIYFSVDEIEKLAPLLYWLDGCHTNIYGWKVFAITDCVGKETTFVIESDSRSE